MRQLVTVKAAGQLFALPILQVRDVFLVQSMTPVPLAPGSMAGLFNLRGRVITMLSMKALLGHDRTAGGDEGTAIGIEWQNEAYGLLVDAVGEVMTLDMRNREPSPANLDRALGGRERGRLPLPDGLLVKSAWMPCSGAASGTQPENKRSKSCPSTASSLMTQP